MALFFDVYMYIYLRGCCITLFVFRWVLLPTTVPKDRLKPRPGEGWKHRDEAITWFKYVYPRITHPSWPKEWAPVSTRTFLCRRASWHHHLDTRTLKYLLSGHPIHLDTHVHNFWNYLFSACNWIYSTSVWFLWHCRKMFRFRLSQGHMPLDFVVIQTRGPK